MFHPQPGLLFDDILIRRRLTAIRMITAVSVRHVVVTVQTYQISV